MDAIIAPIVGGRDEWIATEPGSTRSGWGSPVVSLVAQRRAKVARAVDQTEDEDLLGGDLIDQSVTAEEDLSDSLVLELGTTRPRLANSSGCRTPRTLLERTRRHSGRCRGAMYSAVALRSSSAASVQPTRRATWPSVAWPRPGQQRARLQHRAGRVRIFSRNVDVVLDVFK